jgi:hypothetical protein
MPARRQRRQARSSCATLAPSRTAAIGLMSMLIVFGGGHERASPPAARQSACKCTTLVASR